MKTLQYRKSKLNCTVQLNCTCCTEPGRFGSSPAGTPVPDTDSSSQVLLKGDKNAQKRKEERERERRIAKKSEGGRE